MFTVALLEPEIAGNVGNIARTCLAAGSSLHLIRPFGFRLTDEALRRSGMDYWDETDISLHASFAAFAEHASEAFEKKRVFSFTTKGQTLYTEVEYRKGDVLLFGPESRGLPESIRGGTRAVRLPMTPSARSLNLSVSVGVAVYEAWRQMSFEI